MTTLKSQRRNVLEFLTQAISAKRQGQPTPSLLPQVSAAGAAQLCCLTSTNLYSFISRFESVCCLLLLTSNSLMSMGFTFL